MSEIYTETIMRIYDSSENDAFIQIKEDEGGLGMVHMQTSLAGNSCWGSCDITMNKETVLALIAALNKSLEFAE